MSDAEQCSQVRAERGSVERTERGDPTPVWIVRLAAAVPPIAGDRERSSSAIAIPPPTTDVLGAPP